jgi:hypothetical protein
MARADKHRSAYSFRSSDFRETSSDDGETGDPCARGDWCSAARTITGPDGTRQRVPARSPRPFCDACRTRIGGCLADLPELYVRLECEITQAAGATRGVRVPFGPRLPGPKLGQVDAIMRDTAETMIAWHERVATVANLAPVDTEAARRRHGKSLHRACLVLGAHLDALLALGAEPMIRDGALEDATGTDAGLDILDLHRRARSVLGRTKARPEEFDGVPCRQCGDMALESAEPPSNPKQEAMHSKCASCLHLMDYKTFKGWAKWYAGWAGHGGVTVCRRCQRGLHEQCAWDACTCRLRGHATRIAA